MVFLAELVKSNIYGVEHTDDLHGTETGAHRCEADYVGKEEADRGELLTCVEGGLSLAKLVCNWLWYQLVKEPIRFLDALLKLCSADLLL